MERQALEFLMLTEGGWAACTVTDRGGQGDGEAPPGPPTAPGRTCQVLPLPGTAGSHAAPWGGHRGSGSQRGEGTQGTEGLEGAAKQ